MEPKTTDATPAATTTRIASSALGQPSLVTIAQDVSDRCADVGQHRVCWGVNDPGADCLDDTCRVTRTVPRIPAPHGWRCAGTGKERACVERTHGFECGETTCVQPFPYLPDDGDWSCGDQSGASVCTGHSDVATIAFPVSAPGWICGVRSEPQAVSVCVDFSPDLPPGSGWRCRFELDGLPRRLCTRDPQAHALGDTCWREQPCVDGALCVDGICLPPAPTSWCSSDRDCASSRCRFGSCNAEEERP